MERGHQPASGLRIAIRTDLVRVPARGGVMAPTGATDVRERRKRTVMDLLRRTSGLSRADLARASGINLPTVSSLVEDLISDGLAKEEKPRSISRGRRPVPVTLLPNAAGIVGIDAGRTMTTAVLTNLVGATVARVEIESPQGLTPARHAEWLSKRVTELYGQCCDPVPPLCGIGVGLPGLRPLDRAGTADAIQSALGKTFGVDVIADNDVRMAALGHLWFGSGKELSTFVVVNIGHGIGSGIVINGSVYTGRHGFSGELGFAPLGKDGVVLEETASGSGLIGMAASRGLKVADGSELAKLMRAGDKKAAECFHEFAQALGRGLATLMNMLDPEAVILSGRVCHASDLFLDEALRVARRFALKAVWERSKVMVAPAEADFGARGAAAAILHCIYAT